MIHQQPTLAKLAEMEEMAAEMMAMTEEEMMEEMVAMEAEMKKVSSLLLNTI
jgi:hypothetical protein